MELLSPGLIIPDHHQTQEVLKEQYTDITLKHIKVELIDRPIKQHDFCSRVPRFGHKWHGNSYQTDKQLSDTERDQVIDYGLWNDSPFSFNSWAKLLDIGRIVRVNTNSCQGVKTDISLEGVHRFLHANKPFRTRRKHFLRFVSCKA